MFLKQLTPDQKNSFLALATRLVIADGTVPPGEGAVLDAMKAEMGGTVLAPPEEVLGKLNVAAFASNKSRVIATLDLMTLCYVDEKFHTHEADVINGLCDAFGFPADESAAMRVWAKRQAELFRNCHAILDG